MYGVISPHYSNERLATVSPAAHKLKPNPQTLFTETLAHITPKKVHLLLIIPPNWSLSECALCIPQRSVTFYSDQTLAAVYTELQAGLLWN